MGKIFKKYSSFFIIGIIILSSFILNNPENSDATEIGTIEGGTSDDKFGFASANAGDVNGDGIDDILVGAPGFNNETGRAYLYFGGSWILKDINADSANVTINGSQAGDNFGYSVGGAGDFNNDGFDDIIIGSPNSTGQRGSAYMFFGGPSLPPFIDADNANITITGESAGDQFGFSSSGVGDVNNDGYDDVIIGAPYHDDWWNSSWRNRMKITFNNLDQSETLINFPVLVNLSAANFNYSKAENDGSDIRFIDTDGVTELNFQIEQWDTSGYSYIWVNVTEITGNSADDHIWMYYGNPSANDKSNPPGVWDSNFKGVWHLDEEQVGTGNSDLYQDSTGNDNDGDDNVSATGQDGKINGGQEFDGTDDMIDCGSDGSLNIRDSITLEAWINMDVRPAKNDWYNVMGKQEYCLYLIGNTDTETLLCVELWIDGKHQDIWKKGAADINSSTWVYVVITFDGTDVKGYINGQWDFTDNNPGTIDDSSDNNFLIGDYTGEDKRFDGLIDEVRISNVARSTDWIKAQYLSIDNYFIKYGVEESKDWWNTNWAYCKKLSFDNNGQLESLIDFPVLVNLTPSNFDYSKAKSDGGDLRFIDDDEATELEYEIESWNSSGSSYIWVNVTKINGGSSTDHIWMYYGNLLANGQSNPSGVWDENYRGVWHLAEEKIGTGTPGLYNDSTNNNNDGEDNITATGVEGKVNGGKEFNGNGDCVLVPHNESLNLSGEMTISFWLHPTQDTSTWNRVVEKGYWGYQTAYYFGCGNGINDLTFYLNNTAVFDTANNVLTINTWQHAAVNYKSNGDAALFLNGKEIASGSYTGDIQGNSDTLYISYPNTLYDFPGYIDEVRISDIARSTDWLNAQYLSMNNSFITYGSELSRDDKAKNWWNNDWLYRRKITFDNSAQTEDLINFPVLINLSSINFDYLKSKPDGTDLRFIDEDSVTELKHHIEHWNNGENSYIWVNVTKISKNSIDDHIWMYYGNPDASDVQDVKGTYDDRFVGVWHLNETPTGTNEDIKDSTSYCNNGTTQGGMDGSNSVRAKIGSGIEFDELNDLIRVNDSFSLDSVNDSATIELWVWWNNTSDGDHQIIMTSSNRFTAGFNDGYEWASQGDGDHFFYPWGGHNENYNLGPNPFTDKDWHYLTVTFNYTGKEMIIYVDGKPMTFTATNVSTYWTQLADPDDWLWGGNPDRSTRYFDGIMDEIRISSISRSADWVYAQYISMKNSFISYGAEESSKLFGGVAYIYLGQAGLDNVKLNAENADLIISGENPGDNFGYAVATSGDVNSDNISDFIVGAPGYGSDLGRTYIFYGDNLANVSASKADIILTGTSDNYLFGSDVDSAGDINGDNKDDVIVGAYKGNAAYIYYNGAGLTTGSADITFIGENPGDNFSYSVSGAGDMNNDGYDDVIIGAPGTDMVYMFLGDVSLNNLISASNADQVFSGSAGTAFGSSTAGRFYLDNSPYNQIITGAPYYDTFSEMGKIYIHRMNFTVAISAVKTYSDTDIEDTIFKVGDKIIIRVNTTTNLDSFFIFSSYITIIAPDNSILVDNQTMTYEKRDLNLPSYWKLYNFSYSNPTTAGLYTIKAGCNSLIGVTDNETYYYVLEPGPPDKINVVSNKTSLTADGKSTANLNISIFDVYGNPIPGLGSSIGIKLDDGGGVFGNVIDYGNGTYSVSYISSTSSEPDAIINVSIGNLTNITIIDLKPGPLDHITITPGSIDVQAGETNSFTAEGFDVFNNPVNISGTIWSSNVGSILSSSSTQASFKAQISSGNGNIYASVGPIVGSAQIRVVPHDLVRISIAPGIVDVVVDNTQIFTATGYDQYNNMIKISGTVWTTDAGTITQSNGTHATLRVKNTVGSGYISASKGAISNSAKINIIPDVLDSIVVTPVSVNITVGESQDFSAVGYDRFGNILPINPVWTTTVGSMAGSMLTAQTAVASGYVNASVGSIIGSAIVNIEPAALDKIVITPNLVFIEAGKTQQFSATGYDYYNNIVDIIPVWSTNIGVMNANILTAQTKTGTGYVNASFSGISASALVDVGPGALYQISVFPENVEVMAGGTQQFTSIGYDRYDNIVSITPAWYSSVGIMAGDTLYAQTAVGTGNVTATYLGISGSVNVTIIPAELDHIKVTPQFLEIDVGMSREFNAAGYDQYNNIVKIDPVWSTDVGSFDGKTFTAQKTTGQGSVTATVTLQSTLQEITGKADVIVVSGEITTRPKIASRIPNQKRYEDSAPWYLSLSRFESDEKDSGTNLRWYASGVNTSLYMLTGEYSDDDTLKFTPVSNAYGSNEISLWLIDSDGYVDHQSIWVNLTPVNDAPTIFGAPDITLHYDISYTFDYTPYVNDIDNPRNDLTVSTIETTDVSYTESDGLAVTYNYPEKMLGQDIFVTLMVSDGEDSGKDIIKVSITDDHVPEVVSNLPDITMYEGTRVNNVFDLDDYFFDPDDDSLFYTFGDTHVDVIINGDRSVDISSLSDWFGKDTVSIRAIDPRGALAEDTFLITVLPVNDPPQICCLPDLVVHYDYDYKFDLSPYITDKDTIRDELIISTSDPSHIKFSVYNNMNMIVNFPESMNGMIIPVTINASDGFEFDTYVINITVSEDFPPETHTELPDIEFYEDTQLLGYLNLDEFFVDFDGDILYYSYGFTNLFVTINEDNSVDFSAKENWYGYESVTFRAEDPYGALAEDIIEVIVLPVNDPPTISEIPAQKGRVKEMWIFDLSPYIDDVDNDVTDLKISTDSDLVLINGLKLLFYSDQALSHEIMIDVSDGDKNSTVAIKVTFTEDQKAISLSQLFNWIIIIIILLLIIGISSILIFHKYRGSYRVEEVFLINKKGELLGHKIADNKSIDLLDDIFLNDKLRLIRTYIEEDFNCDFSQEQYSQRPSPLDSGIFNIEVERGKYTYLAVLYRGRKGWKLSYQKRKILTNIEENYGLILYTGNLKFEKLSAIDKMIEPIFGTEDSGL
jgi:hypothetical protein